MSGAKGVESRSPHRLFWLCTGSAVLFALVLAIAGSTFLKAAGRFLAPRYAAKADVVIIEGEELLQEGAVAEALALMAEQRIERLMLVTHRYNRSQMGFGISQRYHRLVAEELERVGLKKRQYTLVSVPVAHPVTLAEARVVLDTLSKESVKSALLVAQGFHTRRSYLLYRDIGKAKGIEIIPWSSSVGYPLTEWWYDEDAVYDFVSQLAKLSYYLLRGYIPLTSLFR